MTAVIIQVYESRGMDVDGLIQSCQTREDWGPTSTYIKPLSPLDPLVELYCTLVKFVAFDQAGHRARKYLSRLYGENSSEFTNLLNTPPILVMASVPSREDGCHYRIVSACDVIFIDYSVIARWRSTLMDPGSIQCRSQLQLIKSLVVHELAHRIITYRMGWALPHDLVTFNKDTTLLPEQDKQSFLRMRNKLANDQTTPPKFHLPWRSSRKAEAGEWLEFKIFGGVVRVDGAGQATLQHSRDTVSPLSPNSMLDHCGTSVLINYVEEYPELAEMNHIILSPSSNQNHRKTVSGGKAQQRLCAGVKRVPAVLSSRPETEGELASMKAILTTIRQQEQEDTEDGSRTTSYAEGADSHTASDIEDTSSTVSENEGGSSTASSEDESAYSTASSDEGASDTASSDAENE